MSPWAKYLKERYGVDSIEIGGSFVTYEVKAEASCIEICDLYIAAESRGGGGARTFLGALETQAKDLGLREIVTRVWLKAPGFARSLRLALAAGFEPRSAESGCITLSKEVLHGK